MITTIKALTKSVDAGDVLDPSHTRCVQDAFYLENLTARLVDMDAQGQFHFQLARDIKFSDDRCDLIIELKKAYFSDGSIITAHDVAQSIKRMILRGSHRSEPRKFIRGSYRLNSLADDIEGVCAVSESKVFLGLNFPMKDILYYLQLPEYGILHASQYDNPLLFFSDWETTSGAYHADSSRGLVKLRANYHTLNSNLAMPREVEPFHSNEDLIHAFEKGEIHVGTMDSESFRNIKRSLPHSGALEIFNHSSGAIIHLVLNANHKKFRSKLNRQWVHRKVLEGLHVPLQDSDLYTKALQYYAPESKGFLHQNEIAGIVNRMPGGAVPEELSGGLVINAPKGIKKYLSSRFIEEMEKALGIKVDLRFDIDTPIYTKFLNDRKFEAMLTINTMSYKVFSEALGHAYTSSAPKFLDPSFRMRTLLTEYSLTHEPGEEMLLIHQILLTIIDDSECVPLAYLNKPKFFNTRVLDISQLDPREPLRLWKLKMRSTPK